MDSLVAEGLGKLLLARPRLRRRRARGRSGRSSGQPLEQCNVPPRTVSSGRSGTYRSASSPGTILGVVGPNGAGKSTLLKVLGAGHHADDGPRSGVGRVVSLLELGAGLEPDLRRRTTSLMNAAIGDQPSRGAARVPEMLKFAEVGAIRRQSAAALFERDVSAASIVPVAIHMNPNILLADDLAVGDSAFQERCLQKVAELGRSGLTVLFVSHDMDAIIRICNRVMWLSRARCATRAIPKKSSTNIRMRSGARPTSLSPNADDVEPAGGDLSVRLVSATGHDIGGAPASEDTFIKIRFRTAKPESVGEVRARSEYKGTLIFRTSDIEARRLGDAGVYEALAKIPRDLRRRTSVAIRHGRLHLPQGDDPKEYRWSSTTRCRSSSSRRNT